MNLPTLFDSRDIYWAINNIACRIDNDYSHRKSPLLVGVLKGACKFMMHLSQQINIECDYDFITLENYDGIDRNCKTRLVMDIDADIIYNRDVILVDDIYDTGKTLHWLKEHISLKHPASIATCVLISKAVKKILDVKIDYVGFDNADNKFFVGYGMDHNGKYRGLPYISALNHENISV